MSKTDGEMIEALEAKIATLRMSVDQLLAAKWKLEEKNAALRQQNAQLIEALAGLLPYIPDKNDALNYAAENEYHQTTPFHSAALKARAALAAAKGEA